MNHTNLTLLMALILMWLVRNRLILVFFIFRLKILRLFRRLTLIWTIINTIGPLTVIVLFLYSNYLQKKSQRLSKQALREIDEYYKTISRIIDAQTNFNNSVVDNFERHEEAMRIIVNYIKAGENNV
ncbi:hypothetical protein FOF71_08090 [Lactobacillus paragasseri]|uniref:Uncharacterized protein n=1 Tax=Lactobacillus gasseri TaxID=1596 RepID=A0AB33CE96_LACGS|nr:hypothetical protein CCE30_00320 [Lactobacillus gasseri]TVU99436.1 hypothetical protein FOF71_08090 [Lactobacillus paragasseri]